MAIETWAVGALLVAAITHALWNAIVKTSGDRLFSMATIMGTSGLLFLPLLIFYDPPPLAAWPYLVASVVVHIVYFVALVWAYRHGDLSVAYPIARGGAPLFVAVGALVFAGQTLSPLETAGVACTSLGISLFAFERGLPKEHLFKPFVSALIVSLLIASYTVIDGIGLRRTPDAMSYIAWLFVLQGIPLIAFVLFRHARRYRDYFHENYKNDIAGGALSGLAYALVLYVLSFSGMAQVSALRETSVLFAVLIGSITLQEKFGLYRWMAAIVVVLGVVLMQVGG